MPRPNIKLDIQKIEDLVAQRLAEILVQQLDWQKSKKLENNQNQHGKSAKIHNH